MSSRAVVIVLLALAIAPMANAKDVLPHHAIALDAQILRPTPTVSDLFAEKANTRSEIWADGTMVASAPSVDVIVMRVTKDGELESACVNAEKAAKAFFAAATQKRTIAVAETEK